MKAEDGTSTGYLVKYTTLSKEQYDDTETWPEDQFGTKHDEFPDDKGAVWRPASPLQDVVYDDAKLAVNNARTMNRAGGSGEWYTYTSKLMHEEYIYLRLFDAKNTMVSENVFGVDNPFHWDLNVQNLVPGLYELSLDVEPNPSYTTFRVSMRDSNGGLIASGRKLRSAEELAYLNFDHASISPTSIHAYMAFDLTCAGAPAIRPASDASTVAQITAQQ